MPYLTNRMTEGDEVPVDMTCKDDDGTVIDITNADPITFYWNHVGAVQTTKLASVQDGPNGVARYDTDSSDILATDLQVQVETTIAGKTRRSDPVPFRVGPKLV